MEKRFNIVKVAESDMTTYRIDGMQVPNNAAICAALTEAAKDVWPYVEVRSGTYSAAQLAASGRNMVYKQILDNFPKALNEIAIVCGGWRCGIADIKRDPVGLFFAVAKFETLAGVKQTERLMLTKQEDLGKVLSTAYFTVPKDIKKVLAFASKDEWRPQLSQPYIDLQRHVIAATSGKILVARHIAITEERNADLEDLQFLPREIEKMAGQEVTVQLCEDGTCITDAKGNVYTLSFRGSARRPPRWYTVVPQETSERLAIDATAIKKAIAAICVGGVAEKFTLSAEHGKEELSLSYTDIDYSINNETKLPVTWKSEGLRISLNIQQTTIVLAMNPTSIRYHSADRAIVWGNEDTFILEMPMMPEGEEPYAKWSTLVNLPVDELFAKTKAEKKKEAKVVVKQIAQPKQTKDATAPLSFTERLRAALIARIAAAA